jgi:hypothetical protein
VSRALSAVLALALAGTLVACGSEDSDQLSEGDVRECLAGNGLGAKPPADAASRYAPLYLSRAPDFSAYSEGGTQVDVVVQGAADKAERTAADVRGAMLPLGISDADQRVVASRNVVAVFAESPSSDERKAVSGCLE